MAIAVRDAGRIILPGIASAHSHAFQRALRGRTQARDKTGSSFWSWRELMYQLAGKLDPESMYALSHFAFIELALSGVTHVGEFHYVHHAPGGAPYSDRLVLADAVVRAALDAGLRITLLRVIYERGGFQRELEPAQTRFSDKNLDDALSDVNALAARYAREPRVRVGIAPHSVRAVTRGTLRRTVEFARSREMPLHAHVAEQPREVDECLAEHGLRPVELLADLGALDARFTAVHATHLTRDEALLLGRARAHACLCRTTERDLGDAAPDVSVLLDAGVTLSTGVDSHALSDPFEEARAIELDERTRTGKRAVALDGEAILRTLSSGYAALGAELPPTSDDRVELDATDPAFVGAAAGGLDDAVAFAASARAVRKVAVAGRTIVDEGRHEREASARAAFEQTLVTLLG